MQKQLALLGMSENRDAFFRRIHRFILPHHDGDTLIGNAYKAAKKAHKGIQRARGERYFEHCRAVALILIDIFGIQDAELIAAALMHDTIEDCDWTRERIALEFGESVASLVDGVSMPEGEFPSRESRLEAYHQKFMAAAAIDPRVILLKIADRMHNLLTCEALARDKQLRMIEETEAVYLPLAKDYRVLYTKLSQVVRMRRKTLRAYTRESRVRSAGAA